MSKTRVYKIELMIVDHDDLGADGVQEALQNVSYPNDCISPQVSALEERSIDWGDDHPLNRRGWRDAFRELFATDPVPVADPIAAVIKIAEQALLHDEQGADVAEDLGADADEMQEERDWIDDQREKLRALRPRLATLA